MQTVGQDRKEGGDIDDDDLDDGVPVGDPGVDGGGVGHRLQPVQGYCGQTQC